MLALLGVVGMVVGSGTASLASGPATTVPPLVKPLMLVGPLAPLTIHGIRFKPRESVTLTLDGGRRGTKRVLTTRAGTFTARFEVKLLPCRTVTIRAVGSMGSRAVRQLPRPNCREP